MMIDSLVFVGPHGSGKTTLGRRIAATLGWTFHDEIGKRLRLEALAHNPDAHALGHQPAFDRQVTAMEMARDRLLEHPRVVETWHPGNLAYAQARSPELLRGLLLDVVWGLRAFDLGRIWVQPLHIDRQTLLRRLDEPGPDTDAFVDGLLAIGHAAEAMAKRLHIQQLPPINTGTHTIEQSVVMVFENLSQQGLL